MSIKSSESQSPVTKEMLVVQRRNEQSLDAEQKV